MTDERLPTASPGPLYAVGMPVSILAQLAQAGPADSVPWSILVVGTAALALLAAPLVRRARSASRLRPSPADIPIVFAPRPRGAAPTPARAPAPPPEVEPEVEAVAEARPAAHDDRTLQILPGRMEVVDGEQRGRQIRFVRTPGRIPEVTFGRGEGPPHLYVRLRSPTVSREHARIRYADGGWSIWNLSRTNPVLVNGSEVGSEDGQRLQEGDRVEMGEVVLRFRER